MLVGTQNEANRVAWIEKTLAKIPQGWRILDTGAAYLRLEIRLNGVAEQI